MPTTKNSLYVPQLEKDSCGTGIIANLNGDKSNKIVQDALEMLFNMEHRGAVGADPNTGDGAGILVQVPHKFFKVESKKYGFKLPEAGKYGVAMVFFPKNHDLKEECRLLLDDYVDEFGFELLGYRQVPVDNSMLGVQSAQSEPDMEQLFLKPKAKMDPKTLEKKLFFLRKYSTNSIYKIFPQSRELFYITSCSYRTIIYKGQLTTYQLRSYFPDLSNKEFESAVALIHSRFSTNTIPRWKLAQPFRYIAHNGEINTITGNLNWWRTKETVFKSNEFSDEEIEMLKPVCGGNLSDSGNFDNALEFLVFNGFSLPHALMMMIPEAWEHKSEMEDYKKAFYEYHKTLMEPWDGPASMCFTDGILLGATLDRNGLRPSRYQLSEDNVLVIGSEAGILPIEDSKIVLKGRLQPGKILIADLDEKRIIGDEELKSTICQRLPYREWLDERRLTIEDLPVSREERNIGLDTKALLRKQQLHGFSREDLHTIIGPMVTGGKDPIGSMGADTPLAVLSSQSQHISNYFKQLFAQVTNPPIDPIRERSVMSLSAMLGAGGNSLELVPEHAEFIHLETPVLSNAHLAKIKSFYHPNFKVGIVRTVFKADGQKGRLKAALDHVCMVAEDLTRSGHNILILNDRSADAFKAPIPSLLATGAIHHHLLRKGLRSFTSLVVEAGDIRETHHVATLIGYGASAVNPYMAFASIAGLHKNNYFEGEETIEELCDRYIDAVGKGLLKILSKIGISTLQSYQGAQIFEALGIGEEVISQCFTGTISRIGGLSYDDLATEKLSSHWVAYQRRAWPYTLLDVGGVYQWKRRGEDHVLNPDTIHHLQHAVRKNDYTSFKKYTALIDDQNEKALTLRGLMEFRKAKAISIDEVEPIEEICKRFFTGAMSFGSISWEAHTTLAAAMNEIGGRSNSGEGGEDESRYKKNGTANLSSRTKQVASGRFGVTSYYLSMADELQIKMAQGAKPGEGGQLPGHKVDAWIARVRSSTPGVGLISPPPHHDIYSIEDLAQLIFDLKNANQEARINVKLVSKAGVGIIASGVTKAHADAILISGHDGGTGASPLSSIRHTGLPWELGVAETQQTLVRNKLRDRVVIQTDGQIRTGRDVAIATLLGAEEWGIASAALVTMGCIMMRKCHLNTCPVGIATQNETLRKQFKGQPDHVINYFKFLATELREIMANLGFRTINEMVGRVERLRLKRNVPHWKYKKLDLSPILYKDTDLAKAGRYQKMEQNHGINFVLDRKLIEKAQPALKDKKKVKATFKIRNTDRTTGAMLSNMISKKFKGEGLSNATIQFTFRGTGGQSFGAFSTNGVELRLEGQSNDYFGKGLSGGRLIIYPDRASKLNSSKNIIIGNVAFYGATSGEAYIRGMAGERFCVRNSGVTTVVEGVGDHGCEYMTGGIVVILGETGINFAAGMSGGIAYVLNPDGQFESKVNMEMVSLDKPDKTDKAHLKTLIHNFKIYTGSDFAKTLLDDWEYYFPLFTKVMPLEFKAVLEKDGKKPTFKITKATV